jgi:riboflavin synthase
MFTGIVAQIGVVSETRPGDTARRIVIHAAGLGDLAIGDSIAVNGVCLTAVEVKDDEVAVDVIPETLSKTNLGDLQIQARVNLERPMLANGRFDGHIVQGHVDGMGAIASVDSGEDGARTVRVEVEEGLRRYLVSKGSVTIDGVSLTVAALTDDGFEIALIPHTLEVTTLGLRKKGDTVNLEVDVLAKYVERLLSTQE